MVLTIHGPILNLLKEMNHKKKTADIATKKFRYFCCGSYNDDYGLRYCRNKDLHQRQYIKRFHFSES